MAKVSAMGRYAQFQECDRHQNQSKTQSIAKTGLIHRHRTLPRTTKNDWCFIASELVLSKSIKN